MLRKKIKPISLEEFPTEQNILDGTNCLAFALGIKNPKRNKTYVLKKTDEPMEAIFLKKVKQLGFKSRRFKKIEYQEENKTTGYIIRVYGFVPEETAEYGTKYDFHLIRREADGQWVHKPGFLYPPREVSYMDWITISERYGNKFVSFAIDA